MDDSLVAKVKIPVDLEAPAHLGAAYASGPHIDACLRLPIAHAQAVLGDELQTIYGIPRSDLAAAKRRFEELLQSTSDHLRRLAISTLPARGQQKRPAEEESSSGRYACLV